ncbi:hypothetical protein SAMN04515675_0117 [Pseudomonas costantinii]|uniref:Beta-ketoacyl-[acyl-carrier-protein] synthase III N-terminal domain-containing protein n=3 Tax=Pseudomonas costantinii TaxID=168469 RepID=A0A1H4YIU0_9PSED|nr:hypothetical protein SAMN04515675_0117 [Pseudomonas costantinii]
MRVAMAVSYRPALQPVMAARAQRISHDYWYLLGAGVRDLIPLPGAHCDELEKLLPPPGSEVPMDQITATVGDLAAKAVEALKQRLEPADLAKIDAVFFCTSGIDSPLGVSVAGRLQHILGATTAFPCVIGQNDGCAAFEAMRIARAFIQGPARARSVVLVACECWLQPYLRSFGHYVQYGDGAAAILLVDDDQSGQLKGALQPPSLTILHEATSRYEHQQGPFERGPTPWYTSDRWAAAVGRFLQAFLAEHHISPEQLGGIHSPAMAPAFLRAVGNHAQLELEQGVGGVVSCVEPLFALQALMDEPRSISGPLLSWSVGLNGEMGACLYERDVPLVNGDS